VDSLFFAPLFFEEFSVILSINFVIVSKMSQKIRKLFLFALMLFVFVFNLPSLVHAAPGDPIVFQNLDNLLQSVISTIRYYSLPVMAIILALLGVKLIISGDDTSSKDLIKSWMIKILIGGAIIFGASVLAGAIKTAVSI
jgi:hypothetical protein